MEALTQIAVAKEPLTMEYDILPLTSGRKHIFSVTRPIVDETGQVRGVFGIVQDITERKQAEKKLQESEQKLNRAQSIAKVGSWEFDLRTQEQTWSQEHYHIFDLKELPPDQLFAAYRSKIHPEDIPALDHIIEQAMTKGENIVYEHRVICDDGRIKHVLGLGEVVKDENNVPILVRGTAQDITEQKQAEEKIRASLH